MTSWATINLSNHASVYAWKIWAIFYWHFQLSYFSRNRRFNIFSEYNQQDATFLNLVIPVRRSTCFRRFCRPSSRAQNCIYGVRHLPDAIYAGLLYLYLSSSSSSSVICQTTGPKPLPKRFLHIVRSRASSFNWQYPLLSVRSSSSFIRILPRLLVTSICPFIFPSITCCRRQFLRKMWPIQLAFRFLISCRIFLCLLILSNTSSFLTWSVQLIFSILLQHHISKLSSRLWSVARNVQVSASYRAMLQSIQQ